MIEFTISHAVQPKQGDRVRVIKTRDGRAFATHYTPAKVSKNADSLASLMAPYVPPAPMEGPLRLFLRFDYPWRAGDSKKARASGPRPKDTKPDWDNLCKNVADVMQASGFYTNDSQLAEVNVAKVWSGRAGLTVKLEPINGAS